MSDAAPEDTTTPPAAGGAAAPTMATAATDGDDALAPGVTPEDETAEVSECWGLSRRVVTKAAMKRLGVRIISEDVIENRQVYLVTRLGYNRLRDAGYRFSNQRATALDGIMTADVEKPAEVAAAAPAAPAPAAAAPAAAAVAEKAPKDVVVTVKSWNGEEANGFKTKVLALIKECLADQVKRDIDLYVPHAASRQPIPGPNFNIFVWSSPNPGGEDAKYMVPETLWGLNGHNRDAGHFVGWDQGTNITTTEGDEVGSFDKNNLYLYWDAIHGGRDQELAILKKFFTVAAQALKDGIKPPSLVDMRDRYVALCGKRHAAQVKQAEDDYRRYEEQIPQHQKALIEAVRQRDRAQVFMLSAKTQGTDADKHFANEFDAMRRMEKITNVYFRGDCLTVETDPLYFIDPRSSKMHEIGRMRISINTVTGVTKMMNLTRTVNAFNNGMQAPHVFPDGKGCLGSVQMTLPDLVASYEYAAAVNLMLAYLESVNVDDGAGAKCHLWPEVDPVKVKKEQEERAAAKLAQWEAETGVAQAMPGKK